MTTTAPRTASETIARADLLAEARALLDADKITEASAVLDKVEAMDAAHADTTARAADVIDARIDARMRRWRAQRDAFAAERARRARARGEFNDPDDPAYLDYLIGRN